MSKPLISVIVPCYNQAQYLDECLQSVLDQTYDNWECIIVNDGSPDHTDVIAQNWVEKDARFKYLYKENGGLSSARNAGIEIANGEWIQFLDSDDILEHDKLLNSIKFVNDGVDIIISGYRYFETVEGVSKKRIVGRDGFIPEVMVNKYDAIDIKSLLRLRNICVVSAPIYSSKIFKKIGNFDTRLKSLEDWEFNVRCAFNDFIFHHIGYIKDGLTLIRLHNNSMMRNTERMSHNMRLFDEIVNSNPLIQSYFGVSDNDLMRSKRRRGILRFIKIFIPPILYGFFKKVLNKIK